MKKTVACLLAGLLALPLFTGCAIVSSPLTGGLYTQVDAPLIATSNEGSSKVGTASAESILGWVAIGDASIKTAMQNGGITKVHHVDYKAYSILGLYAKYTVYVYGE